MKQKAKYKDEIKNVAIVYRPGRPDAKKKAIELGAWLAERKINVFCHPKRKFMVNKKDVPPAKTLARLQLVVVLGGDGTYLEAVRMLGSAKVPIVGVNMGSLGFLTENRVEDLYQVMLMAIEGKMELRPRSMINLKVKYQNKIQHQASALNDVVLERGSRSHLIYVNLCCDKMPVSRVKADGIIISSPTGSTAYNLAAGGPICHPNVEAFVVTPICPHSLTNRPLIFPDNQILSIKLNEGVQKASLTVDGKHLTEISDQHEVIIEKCRHCHFVLKKPSHNYFTLLNEKLKFNQR